jgi:hypothetical protein
MSNKILVQTNGRVIVRPWGSSRSRSGGFNTVNHTLDILVSHPWRGRLGGGVGDDGGDWWSFPSLRHVPSRSVRVWSEELQWRRRTSWSEPVAPTPSYSAARQGPTSLLTGWAFPIRTRVKGPMGCWAHWWRDQSNILPLDLTYIFNFFSHSITDQCMEHVLSWRSISFLSISDRLNSYNTHLCTKTNSLDLGPLSSEILNYNINPCCTCAL